MSVKDFALVYMILFLLDAISRMFSRVLIKIEKDRGENDPAYLSAGCLFMAVKYIGMAAVVYLAAVIFGVM